MVAVVLILGAAATAMFYAWDFWRPGARHFRKGAEMMTSGDPSGAIGEWLKGAAADPKDPRCPEMLGDFYVQARRPEQAVDFYERAARKVKNDGTLYLRLSRAYHVLGARDKALETAAQAVRLRPNDAEVMGHQGIVLAKAKKRPEALASLTAAHNLDPGNRGYLLAMVEVEMDTLQMAAAEKHLLPYLQAHPDDHEACFKMAVIFNQKPRTRENLKTAIRYAEKALPGMPKDGRGYTVLGQLYLDAGRTKDALQLYKIGREFVPNAESILRGLADCYTRLGMTKELAAVSAEFRKVLARHDRLDHLTHVMSFNNKDFKSGLELARLTEEEGRMDEARQYFEQLVRQEPQRPETRKALSAFYARRGSKGLARQALQPQFVP